MQAIAVQDVGANDIVVGAGFGPFRPVGSALLDGGTGRVVAFGVPLTDDECSSVLVGLHDTSAEGGCDDAWQPRAGTQLEQGYAAYGARRDLVCERDGGRPERDAVRQARLIPPQEPVLVLVAEDGTSVQDGPGV